MLRTAEARATALLVANRDLLERVVDLLLLRETIDGADLATLLGLPQRNSERELIDVAPGPRESEPGVTADRAG